NLYGLDAMEAEAKYRYVGIALLALAAALVGGLLWLRGAGTREEFRYYTIYFDHLRLDGLLIGADVDMRGIQVRRVEEYGLQPGNISRVRVTIRVDRRAPVSDNTVAVIRRNTLTAVAWVSLETPDPPGPPLVATAPNEHHPVIREGEGSRDPSELA